MATYAILNEQGVIVGYERGTDDVLSGTFVQVDDECDLDPGRYYWDGDKFIPLPPSGSANAAKDINVLRCIFLGYLS